jgi:hypothetical protein
MDPNITGEQTITLDKPRPIRFAHYSQFRLSQQAAALAGNSTETWGFHQLLVYVWAMLDKEGLKRFPDPEDLGEFITPANVAEYGQPVIAAIAAGMGDSEKKTKPSRRGRSSG